MPKPEKLTDEEWAKAIIMHLTGHPEEPTPMLLKMITDLRGETTEELVKEMVDRFLCWRLPDPWHPDCGIHFDPDEAKKLNPNNHRYEPVGTNLFDAGQAEAMVRHMLGLPAR